MLLGVIGDDFTGSSDIANNLKKRECQLACIQECLTIK